jgi:hypothetical protein
MQRNLISAAISDADQANIAADIADIQKILAPVLIFNLTPQERLESLKMGDKTLAFVQKSLEYATSNPSIVPAFLDVDEANKDYALARALYTIYQQLITLIHAIEDSMMVSGGESYDGALIFYNALKGAIRSNVPGSQAIEADLKERFPRKSKKAAATPVVSK